MAALRLQPRSNLIPEHCARNHYTLLHLNVGVILSEHHDSSSQSMVLAPDLLASPRCLLQVRFLQLTQTIESETLRDQAWVFLLQSNPKWDYTTSVLELPARAPTVPQGTHSVCSACFTSPIIGKLFLIPEYNLLLFIVHSFVLVLPFVPLTG